MGSKTESHVSVNLSDLKRLSHWKSTSLPIASSEIEYKAVLEKLNFNDAFRVAYSNGKESVELYIAYWEPGRAQPRAVSHHSPDTCWVESGWVCQKRTRNYSIKSEMGKSVPGEWGIYSNGQDNLKVFFVHLVGEEPYSYEEIGIPGISTVINDAKHILLNGQQQQFFIRLTWAYESDSQTISTEIQRILSGLEEIVGVRDLWLEFD